MVLDALDISLPDIALLARVQRPLVSTWRSRFATSSTPFPAPVRTQGVQPYFDGYAVVDWLETTGLGNNPGARGDLAAFAALADTDDADPVVFAGMTALLCLGKFDVRLPVDADQLLELADEVDPDDAFLYSELEMLGERLEPMARYATLLLDAAGGAASAFESLMARRTRRPGSGLARTTIAAPVRHLVARAALAFGTHAEIAAPCFVDPTPGASDLIVELSREAGEWGAVTVATPSVDSVEGRLARRRIRVHDVVRRPLHPDGHGGFAVPDDAVIVMALPAPDRPDPSDDEVLAQIDDLVLGMEAIRYVVVLGPASALTDRLRGTAAERRDAVLRSGRVRGVVRLPAGQVPGKPRARLAMWCLGPQPAGTDEPRTLVADLADVVLDDVTLTNLVTDLVAGLRYADPGRAHVAQFAWAVPTRTLLARLDDLVEPRATALPHGPADLLERSRALSEQLAAPLPVVDVRSPSPREVDRTPLVTLGSAVDRREVQILPGLRIEPADLTTDAGVRVIGSAQLTTGADESSYIDRLVLAARYPAARFTEPGDVIFATGPRPAATVDRSGGAVAAFPARVLRTRSAAFVAAVLAADINALPATAKTWRAWNVRTVPEDQAEALTGMLDDLDRHRRLLTDRLTQLDQLAATLVVGATAGTFDLS